MGLKIHKMVTRCDMPVLHYSLTVTEGGDVFSP